MKCVVYALNAGKEVGIAIIVTAQRNAMTKRSYFQTIGQALMIDTRHLFVAKIVG